MDRLRDKFAKFVINFFINYVASKEYSKMLNVMVGFGQEQFFNRQPINYDQELIRLVEEEYLTIPNINRYIQIDKNTYRVADMKRSAVTGQYTTKEGKTTK